MKILSDFDGVLTELSSESDRVRELFSHFITECSNEAPQLLRDAAETVRLAPHLHGWRVSDRITAYADEDGFIAVNAMAACLDGWADQNHPLASLIRKSFSAHFGNRFVDIAQRSYQAMAKETAEGKHSPLEKNNVVFLLRALADGHEIVIVSNSSTHRIIQLLEGAGLHPNAQLRVRGDAQKYSLGSSAHLVQLGSRAVDIDRPHYLKILKDEKPDVVVGDVFSLDLSLPWHLNQLGEIRASLFLRRRHYTPVWVSEILTVANQQGVTLGIIESLDSILAVH